MIEENYLRKLKSVYKAVLPTPRLKYYGWKEVSDRIGDEKPGFSFFGKKMAFALASMTIVVLGGFSFYTSVKASVPGGFLYPVKILSENVVVKVINDSQIKVDNRADEIIKLIEKKSEDSETLQKVSSQYLLEVTNILKKEDSQEQRDYLREHLEEDNKRFNEAIEKYPELEDDIKDAIDASRGEEHSLEDD